MGNIDVVAPVGIRLDIDGLAIMGNRQVEMISAPTCPGAPVIRVKAVSIMGGLRVRSQRGPMAEVEGGKPAN